MSRRRRPRGWRSGRLPGWRLGLGLVALVALVPGVAADIRGGSAASLSLTSQALTPSQTCVVTATPRTTTAVLDANVRQGSPASAFGATTSAAVSSANGANQRLYLRFDLAACDPSILPSATVRLATIRLYLVAVPAACRTLDAFRVTGSWSETTITWNNQPFGTAIGNPPSGSRTGAFTVGSPVGCANRATGLYVTGAIVTPDVAAFVAGTAVNEGWMIRDDAEGSATARLTRFATKERGVVAQAPQLVVSYVTVP